MNAWVVIILLGLGTAAFKALGPVTVGGRPLPSAAQSVIALLAPVLIASLAVVGTFASGQQLVIDARTAGVAIAALLMILRAPTWLVLGSAVVVVALIRQL